MFNWGGAASYVLLQKKLVWPIVRYKLDYGSAGDYELMLKFIHSNNINAYCLNKVLIQMVVGDISNKSLNNRVQAMRNNDIFLPMVTILLKPLRKMAQFF